MPSSPRFAVPAPWLVATLASVGWVSLAGCSTPNLASSPPRRVSATRAALAQQARSSLPPATATPPDVPAARPTPPRALAASDSNSPPAPSSRATVSKTPARSSKTGVRLASAEDPAPTASRLPRRGREEFTERLELPPGLPGAEAPPAILPPSTDPEARARAMANLFPPLPEIAADPPLDPSLPRYTLAELEARTLALAPTLDQARQAITAAEGVAWQVARPPNPQVGYEGDTLNTNGTSGYNGVYFEQVVRTGGKLELARQSATYNVANAQLDAVKAQADQLNAVRKAWFAVLVARENVRVNRVLAEFTESIFELPVDQVRDDQVAPYEPLPLRALAVQARANHRVAIAREESAWRQLAAAVGDPELPRGMLDGSALVAAPAFDQSALAALIDQSHTDLLAATNRTQQARVDVEAACRARVPDLRVYSAVQHDATTPPIDRTTFNVQIGLPVPVFDLNRGNIQKAQADLARAARESERVRNDLRQKLADAWQRYEAARIQVAAYRTEILPDQARAYLGFVKSHDQAGGASYTDIVVAQQNLSQALSTYLAALADQWSAWADLLQLLQVQDLAGWNPADPLPAPATFPAGESLPPTPLPATVPATTVQP